MVPGSCGVGGGTVEYFFEFVSGCFLASEFCEYASTGGANSWGLSGLNVIKLFCPKKMPRTGTT